MTLVAVVLSALGFQAPVVEVQAAFETGAHDRVIAAAQGSDDPATLYLAGLSYLELNRIPEARDRFKQLAARPDDDAWHFVGASALSLNPPAPDDGVAAGATNGVEPTLQALEGAETAARTAAALDDAPALAHYQLGLTLGRKQAYEAAAAAFEAVIARDPAFAYAHYYAGLSYYQVDRTDRMAAAFETFLDLAPEAPERERVESVLRTLRGRR